MIDGVGDRGGRAHDADLADALRAQNGPFEAHSTIAVTPVGLDTLQSTITELVANQVLAEQTSFNGLVLLLRHTLRPLSGGGTRITRQLEISGDSSCPDQVLRVEAGPYGPAFVVLLPEMLWLQRPAWKEKPAFTREP